MPFFCRFLFHKDSAAYRQYANLVDQYKGEREEKRPSADSIEIKPDLSEIYEPEMALEDEEEEDDADGNALTEIKQVRVHSNAHNC